MYGELGVAAYTIEFGSTFFESCSVFEDEMLPDAFATLTAAFMAARQPYTLALAPDITALHAAPQRIIAGMPVTVTAAIAAAGPCTDTRQVMLRSGIDLPSWASGAAIVTATHSAVDLGASATSPVTLTARVDTSAWLPGRHLLWVEAVEGENLAGAPRAAWIDVVEDGVRFEVQPPADSAQAQPGTAATYKVAISNTGLLADSYAVSVEDSSWPTQASVVSMTVPAGATGSIQVRVEVPAETKPGEADDARLRLVSLTEPETQQLITLHTVAGNYLYYCPLYFLP